MRKQWLVWFAGCSLLLAPETGRLLAQKGQGKGLGGTGLGVDLPPVVGNGGASASGSSSGGVSTKGTTTSGTGGSVGLHGHEAGRDMDALGLGATDRLASNTNLSARIQPLLPPGSSIASASSGFENQGQFIAALHVAQNLNIPFAALKTQMTGANAVSLGQAIHELKPDLSRKVVRADVRVAERQTEQDAETARLMSQLSNNSTLAARAQALLPGGTSLQAAAAGFENARELLLVEHISHDLNIPFAQLKTDVTANESTSLANAVSTLRPDLSSAMVKANLKIASQETRADLQAAGALSKDDKEVAER